VKADERRLRHLAQANEALCVYFQRQRCLDPDWRRRASELLEQVLEVGKKRGRGTNG
jgi:hypothetical protein